MSNNIETSTKSSGITEDEAALYDRQIRLWGVEAQNRMRTSSILILNLKGISVEILKNLVLAGIGKITLLDDQLVNQNDLGCNYFLREDEIGLKRVEAALPRIQALNPRVNVQTETDLTKLEEEEFLSSFDLIVITEVDAPTLDKINTLTRKLGKKLFAAASVGIDGWIFADLLEHEFMVDKFKTVGLGEVIKVPTKILHSYVPFSLALKHNWSETKPRLMKKISSGLWNILTLFATQIAFPSQPLTLDSLSKTASTHLPSLSEIIPLPSPSTLSRIATTNQLEFPPTVAIIGGILGQDILNTLGGKEEPVRNLMIFEGDTGNGNVWALGL